MWSTESHSGDISVFCLLLYLRIRPRSHWKIPSELKWGLSFFTLLQSSRKFCSIRHTNPEIHTGIFGQIERAYCCLVRPPRQHNILLPFRWFSYPGKRKRNNVSSTIFSSLYSSTWPKTGSFLTPRYCWRNDGPKGVRCYECWVYYRPFIWYKQKIFFYHYISDTEKPLCSFRAETFFFGVLTQNDITWERYVTSGLRHQLHRSVLLNFLLTLLCIQICISSVYFRAALVWLSLVVCQKANDWSIL